MHASIDGKARRAIAAAAAGNVLEWYDFIVYSFLATVIARNFFPSGNERTALLATFATFWGRLHRASAGRAGNRLDRRPGRPQDGHAHDNADHGLRHLCDRADTDPLCDRSACAGAVGLRA